MGKDDEAESNNSRSPTSACKAYGIRERLNGNKIRCVNRIVNAKVGTRCGAAATAPCFQTSDYFISRIFFCTTCCPSSNRQMYTPLAIARASQVAV